MTAGINPNDIVYILPTKAGWTKIRRHHHETNAGYFQRGIDHFSCPPKPNDLGFIRGQFWSLMQYFDFGASCLGGYVGFSEMLTEQQMAERIAAASQEKQP